MRVLHFHLEGDLRKGTGGFAEGLGVPVRKWIPSVKEKYN